MQGSYNFRNKFFYNFERSDPMAEINSLFRKLNRPFRKINRLFTNLFNMLA